MLSGGGVLDGPYPIPVVLLLAGVFLVLWRRSRLALHLLWGAAWLARAAELAFGPSWPVPAGLAEAVFAVVVLAAAQASAGTLSARRLAAMAVLLLPSAGLLVYWRPIPGEMVLAGILAFAFLYHFGAVRVQRGGGSRIFQAALLALSVVWCGRAAFTRGWTGAGAGLEMAASAVLTLAALASWTGRQASEARDLNAEVDRMRRENLIQMNLDRLTGLLNQSALARRLEVDAPFEGVVAVCDMDDFKAINDRYGHLAGDEILRGVGQLLRASVRHEDEAFRWGGDEFVILFQNEDPAVARGRMQQVEERLRSFRLRGHGTLPISFSWGTAEAHGRPLRESLDEADQEMYRFKRHRRT